MGWLARVARWEMHSEESILVVGLHQATEAYPNTIYRLHDLRTHYNVREINEPLWSDPAGGWRSTSRPWRTLLRFVACHLRIFYGLIRGPRPDVAYIPYPAPSVSLLISLLPKSRRPKRVVADGFISIYDTIVNDRKIWKASAPQSRVLHALERQSFLRSDLVIVDTLQNVEFYAKLFALERELFAALPLATNEVDYVHDAYQPANGRCRVLFIGTLVPLHGISTIIEAAQLLVDNENIEFHILGDGSGGDELQGRMPGLPNVKWQRRWHSAAELASSIRQSDICLGVFGHTPKAQRVCPYKLQSYAAIGRATITGDTDWLRSITEANGSAPFHSVPVNDSYALAEAIRYLAGSRETRVDLARRARSYYHQHLENHASFRVFCDLLFGSSLGRACSDAFPQGPDRVQKNRND